MVRDKGKVLTSSVEIFRCFSGSGGVPCVLKMTYNKVIVLAIINE